MDRPDPDAPQDGYASESRQRTVNWPLRSMLDSMPGAWFFIRLDATLAFVNDAAAQSLGYTRLELLSLRWLDFTEASDPRAFALFWASLPSNEPTTLTTRQRRKDLTSFPVEVRASRILLDGEELVVANTVDLTERETARASLVESEARFGRILEQVPDLVFRITLDPMPRFEFVSPNSLTILGYAPDEIHGSAKQFERIVHADDRPNLLSAQDSGIKGDSIVRFIHRDGHFIWMDVRKARIASVEFNVRLEGVARDVTRELEHEQALEESVELLRSIIDHAPVIVWSLDRTGRFELSEGKGLGEMGLKPGQIVGMSVWDLYAEFPAILEATRRALAGESVDGTWNLGAVQFDFHYAPHFGQDSKPAGATGVAVDVSRRHRAEHTNQQLLTAIEQAAEAVVVTDPTGKVVYVNPAFVSTSGFSKQQVEGQPWSRFEIADDAEFLEGLSSLLTAGRHWSGRIRSRRCDGTRFDEEATLSPIRGDRGEMLGCVAVKRDITRQIRWEEQLRQSQKMEAVGQLAGGIAHDFNNLLQIIQGNLELFSQQPLGEYGQHLLDDVAHATDRAKKLVGQLLAFSRKDSVEFVTLRLDRVIFALLGMLRRLLGEDIEVLWEAGPAVPHIRGNSAQIEQVVVNLCVNARDAMPRGGRLKLSVEGKHQDELGAAVGAPRDSRRVVERYAVLTVHDEGDGMPEEVRQRIFEPFFTTKGVGKGTGLGLATVYAITERHGGFIDVSSELGRGTGFRLYFPAIVAEEAPSGTFKVSRTVTGRDRLVLVAEDDPQVRNLTARFLVRSGFRVITATDGLEAEAVISKHEAELSAVVLDAIMPHLRGPDVYLRMRERGCMVPCLIVTGYDFQSLDPIPELRRALVLQKPFDGPKLFDKIAQLLGE
jgi:two-component system, cell cycle sensor histidine kinase and response regulator CckA